VEHETIRRIREAVGSGKLEAVFGPKEINKALLIHWAGNVPAETSRRQSGQVHRVVRAGRSGAISFEMTRLRKYRNAFFPSALRRSAENRQRIRSIAVLRKQQEPPRGGSNRFHLRILFWK